MDSPAIVRLDEVDSAYWLFSHMKTIGSFQTAARLRDSCTTPWLDAPSPKKAMTTRSVRRRRAASAAPLPMGRPAATIPLQPRMLRSEEHTSELQSRENLVCR